MITVFEAELAFAPGAVWTPGLYRTGFGAGAAAAQEADERGDAAAAGEEAGASAAADEDVATSSTQLMVRGAAACMRSRCCIFDSAARPFIARSCAATGRCTQAAGVARLPLSRARRSS
jgi:hypothetical protein